MLASAPHLYAQDCHLENSPSTVKTVLPTSINLTKTIPHRLLRSKQSLVGVPKGLPPRCWVDNTSPYTGLSLMMELMDWARLAGQWAPRSCRLHLSSLGSTDTCSHAWTWVPGTKFRSSGLHSRLSLTKPSPQSLPLHPHEVTGSLVTDFNQFQLHFYIWFGSVLWLLHWFIFSSLKVTEPSNEGF